MATNSDFLSFTSTPDILAPHLDLSESELDLVDSSPASIGPFHLQSLIIKKPNAFNFLHLETLTCSLPSILTVSSELATMYNNLSVYSESLSNHPSSNYLFPFNLNTDLVPASINTHGNYSAATSTQSTASGVTTKSMSDYSYDTSRHLHSPATRAAFNFL